MKRLTLLLCVLAVALFSLRAHADVDPRIGLGDPNCHSFNESLGTLFVIGPSGSFTFASNNNGGGFFGFCNQSGAIFRTVDIKFADPSGPGFISPSSISCVSTVFDNCDVTLADGVLDLFFHNTQTESQGDSGGIPNDHLMTINLNDPSTGQTDQCVPTANNNCSGNAGGWSAGLQFFGQGNGQAVIPSTVPEPASMLLLSSGLVALWRFRRRRV